MKNQSGFTIFESVVTVALMGILARVMMLSYTDFQESFSKNDARYQLDADLRRLRNEAVAAGGRGVLVISADAKSYTVGLDLSPYGASGSYDRVLFRRTLPSMITLTSAQVVAVNSRGYVIDSSGNLSSTMMTLRFGSEAYYSATLYPTGALS